MGITIGHIIANNTVLPDNDMTWFLFGDGTIIQQKYSGTLTWQNMMALGMRSGRDKWERQPTRVRIGNGVTSIGDSAFPSCNKLISVTIPASVTSIGSWAFHYCSGLTSVTIPDGVKSIGERVFYNCSGLTGTLSIPDNVTSIGSLAFYGCSGLTSVTFDGKDMSTVQGMTNYPWGLASGKSIICTDGTITVT